MAFSRAAQTTYFDGGGATTIVFPAMTTVAGDLIVGSVRWEGGGAPDSTVISSVSDDDGNTYVIGPTKQTGGSEDQKLCTFYCLSAGGQTNNVITVTISASRGYRGGLVARYTNSGSVGYISSSDGADSTNQTAFTTGTLSASVGDLLYGCVAYYNGGAYPLTWGSGQTDLDSSFSGYTGAADRVVASATTYAASGTYSSADTSAVLLLQFREGVGGGGGGGVVALPALMSSFMYGIGD